MIGMTEVKEKKAALFRGYLTQEKFEELCRAQGYTKSGEPTTDAPEGTIFSGHLDIEKLKELCYAHLELKSESDQYSPRKNDNIITLIKQEDGTWTAQGTQRGEYKKTRELAPEHALQQLMYGH